MSIQSTIESYRKRRQQLTPLIISAAAILLVIIGIVIIILSLRGGGSFTLFSRSRSTPMTTSTPTTFYTPTMILSPTNTSTPIPTTPYPYTVEENDTLLGLVEERNLGPNGLILIYQLNSIVDPTINNVIIDPFNPIIRVGDTIILPPQGMELYTPTPWPTDASPGTRIKYFVLPGDSLGVIANKLNSTVDAIVNANKEILVEGETSIIYPGWFLIVPVNLVKPIPTTGPSPSPTPTASPTASITITPKTTITQATTPTRTATP